jgi:hypothetical protein
MVGMVRQDKKERKRQMLVVVGSMKKLRRRRRRGLEVDSALSSAGAQSRDSTEGALQVAEQERLKAEEERERVRELTVELEAAEEELLHILHKYA